MKRWCCVMDCNCTELLKRGMADETLSNHQNISYSSSLPTFSSFFSDFQMNMSKNDQNPMQSLLPDTSHTSLLYTTFIRSFSSCTHQVMVMESENTCITFLPILDPEDVTNNMGTTNSKFSMYHTPPSMSMLLIVADVLNNQEKKKSNVIFQHFCNETFLKILESIIYLFISKTTLSSITTKQSSDKVAKKIPQVKITLNSMSDVITYLLQSSTPYSIKKSFDFENDLKETPSINSYLHQPFEQLCLRPGRKIFKFPEVRDNEVSFQKLMNSLHSTFKNGIFCSAIYTNSGFYYTGLEWHKVLNQQQLTAISVYMNSLAHSQNDFTTRDIPIIVRENVATRLITIKLIDNIQYCAIVYGDTKASDISNVIQFKGDEWAKAVIRLSNIMTKSLLSLIYDISEKNEVLSEITHLTKVKAMLLLNNSGTIPYYLFENFVNSDTDIVLYEKIEHTLREFYINSMMTVFDIFQPQGDEFNVDINETYVITKELAISAYKKNQSVLFCVFDSTCPRYEFSVITQEILNVLTRKNLL